MDTTWRASYDKLYKLLTDSNYARDCAHRAIAGLRATIAKLDARIAELEHNVKVVYGQLNRARAKNEALKREYQHLKSENQQLKGDAEAREATHRVCLQFAISRLITHYDIQAERSGELLQSQTQIADLRGKLRKSESDNKRLRAAAQAAEQQVRRAEVDKKARIADSVEKERIAEVEKADMIARAERAEEIVHTAEQAAEEGRLRIDELKEDVKAGLDREDGLHATIVELRAEVSSKEETVGQLLQDCAELRKGNYEIVRDYDTYRSYLERTRVVGSAEKLPGHPSPSLASLTESHNDSDTPSLTLSDSGSILDDSPTPDTYLPLTLPTPADACQSAVRCTLTTSTSIQFVSPANGTSLIAALVFRALNHVRGALTARLRLPRSTLAPFIV